MELSISKQEFAWLQCFLNDLYQDYQVRSGPTGSLVERLRSKFLLQVDTVVLLDDERNFLLYNVTDVFQTSHTPIVKPQVSLQVSYVGEQDTKGGGEIRVIRSQIQELEFTSGLAQLTPTYPTWYVMQSIMTKLGQSAPPPYTGENTEATVDRSAQMNGPEPNVNPDDRLGNTKDGQRTL